MKIKIVLIIISLLFLMSKGHTQPLYIQCQWQDNPDSVFNVHPEFIWANNGNQTAWQILVSDNLNNLKSNKGDYWDTGKVISKNSDGVSYAGKELQNSGIYYWKIRTWENGKASEYSKPMSFKMANHLFEINPVNEIIAESWTTLTFKIIVGEGGIKVGDGFSLLAPVWGNRFKWKLNHLTWSLWQTDHPNAEGYTTVSSSRVGSRINMEVAGIRNVLNLKVDKEDLRAGDIITITYGDQTKGGPGVKAPQFANRSFFSLQKLGDSGDTWGKRAWQKFKDAPSVKVVGKSAESFKIAAQPLQNQDEEFLVKIVAIDDKGNLDVNFKGKVSVRSSDPSAKLPEVCNFDAFDRGFKTFKVALNTKGIHTITAAYNDIEGKSNAIEVNINKSKSKIFFGDFHGHTYFSDGVFWIDDDYIYARDVASLDFAAVTDHTEAPYMFSRELVVPYVNRYLRTGNFVTLYTHEWTRGQGFGHLNPLFREEKDFNIYNSTDYNNPTELWAALEGLEVITPPHHPASSNDNGAGGYDWNFYNDKFLKTVEIASKHGISECMPEQGNPYPIRSGNNPRRTVQYAIGEKGYKLGFVGASDCHATRLGELYHKNGGYEGSVITGVYTKNLTREAIYDAIKNRSTYATTGEKILMQFNVDGHPMGKEYSVKENHKPRLSLKVGATAPIKELVVWKYSNSKGWEKKYIDCAEKTIVEYAYTDNNFTENSLYYVRVTQYGEPLEQGWTSPVWVNLKH